MVVLGSFSRRVGVSSTRRANLGGGVGSSVIGGKKTIYGTGDNGTHSSVGSNQGKYEVNGFGQIEPVKKKGLGLWDAFSGRNNSSVEKDGGIEIKSPRTSIGDVKYKIMDDKGQGDVSYKRKGHKKGEIIIGRSAVEDVSSRGRKNLAKKIRKLSEKGGLEKQIGKIRSGDGGKFARDFSERNINKVGRRSQRSGRSFSKGTMQDFLK